MKISVKKISAPYLSSLIKKMLLMDTSVYINIDNENVYSNVYTPTKDVVKSFTLPTKDVFEFDKPLEKMIKLSFFSGSRLLSCLSHFDVHKLSADISYFEDESEGVFYADKITFKDQKLKIDVYCQDISLGFTSMSSEQINRALDDSSKEFSFTISREDFTKVTSLLTMDKGELLNIYGDKDGIHIKTEAFDIIVDDSKKGSTTTKSTFKAFFDRVDKETYEVLVCTNKLILRSQESQTNMAINLAITE
jgi:hypothetical protein